MRIIKIILPAAAIVIASASVFANSFLVKIFYIVDTPTKVECVEQYVPDCDDSGSIRCRAGLYYINVKVDNNPCRHAFKSQAR